MRVLVLLCSATLAAAPSIRLDPPCGATRVRVTWDSEGRAPVRIEANGITMTGDEPATGSSETGDWVSEGMEFRLIAADGAVLATTAVRCTATGSIWPLQMGNEWHFRYRDRAVTGQHRVWRVARMEGEWAVLDPGPSWAKRVRIDEAGRIWRLLDSGQAELFLDPANARATSRATNTLAGTFGEEISWFAPLGLASESGRFVKGLGPSYVQSDLNSGSSGGLLTAMEILEAKIGGVRYGPAYPSAVLIVETQSANVTGKQARNCAVPCYFVACGLVPGADAPGAYRPCIEASLRGGAGRVQLRDATGAVISDTPANGWVRILLPTTPGQYTLIGVLPGTTLTTSIEIR